MGTIFILLRDGETLDAVKQQAGDLLPAALDGAHRRDILDGIPRQLPISLSWDGDVLAAADVDWPTAQAAYYEFRRLISRILDAASHGQSLRERKHMVGTPITGGCDHDNA